MSENNPDSEMEDRTEAETKPATLALGPPLALRANNRQPFFSDVPVIVVTPGARVELYVRFVVTAAL
ncbi:hypothetical protein HPB50_001848 [Hyalomma asiaticum]|uniref:Uncharacterized protein n=1 Tax=Hyalomma asiaticum TaxID=266040 RepID=A0ACB7SD15_HYAAI|nr:hypothetical protein HPB50_001848 [Hyalomma asiaticum]